MLKVPAGLPELTEWAKEISDECMMSAPDRGIVYTRGTQYFYAGSADTRAAIYNKVRPFVTKLAGFLMQPTDIRFQISFDSGEPDDVLDRAQLVAEKLSADFRQTSSDITFSEAVLWSLINGCSLLKIWPDHESFKMAMVHPQNFGVLNETVLALDEQEAFCHESWPTLSRIRTELEEIHHPDAKEIMAELYQARERKQDEEEPTFLHQMIVGGMHPVGAVNDTPQAAGLVSVFPVPSPWRPRRRVAPTVRLRELWVHDRDTKDYTVIKLIGEDILMWPHDDKRHNLSRVPGRSSFIKVQPEITPGYFWGRSIIADVQMLQDVLSKRLRDLKVMWDRNVNAPQVLSGFSSVTEEQYYKIISEGGFLNDPNPNAKATKLVEPPPEGYMNELQFIFQMFDEAGGFSPIMQGQGEPGVRAGIHAQTLVRTSAPRLIDQAGRIERQLADTGFMGLRIMQAQDAYIYETENGLKFMISQLPGNLQVEVDSHSASPAFAEDNRQIAIALARAGAADAEDLIHMLHPPGSQMLLARLKQRQRAQAQAARQEKTEELVRDVIGLPQGTHRNRGGSRRRQQ